MPEPKGVPGAEVGAGPGGLAGPGTRYVVATPIGNLGDMSLRAIEVLRAVAVVAAEDTRLTRRLWARHDITTHLVSYHAQSSDRRAAERLAAAAGQPQRRAEHDQHERQRQQVQDRPAVDEQQRVTRRPQVAARVAARCRPG